MEIEDLVIIGAGPAGMSAAINAENDGLKFKLLESVSEGWFPKVSVDSHYTVDNYLGFNELSGTELISKFKEHLANNRIRFEKADIEKLGKKDDIFTISNKEKEYFARSIILATGTKQKKLDIPGIEKYLGNSVFYYCAQDGKQFIDKKVLVIGGRNTGAVTALYLKNLGCDVKIIEKDNQLNAKHKYKEKIDELKIPYRVGCNVASLEGENTLKSVKIQSPEGLEDIVADGIFVCIGLLPNNSLAKDFGIELDNEGYINVNRNMETNILGAYAAGDITGNLKQIIVAAAQGSIAEYNSHKFLGEKWKKE